MNQNSYTKLQKCSKCKKPLEKARVHRLEFAVCQRCKRKRQILRWKELHKK